MDFHRMVLLQHARTHSAAVAPSDLSLEDMLLAGLQDAQLRCRPRKDLNSIVWLLWHMTRAEDVAANLILAGRPQVLDDGDWTRRLNFAARDIGTGMGSDEVDALSANIDIAALRAYRTAVCQRTQGLLRGLAPEDLGVAIASSTLDRLVSSGVFRPETMWMTEFWKGRTKEFFLSFTILGHSYTQLGEGWVIREFLSRTPA